MSSSGGGINSWVGRASAVVVAAAAAGAGVFVVPVVTGGGGGGSCTGSNVTTGTFASRVGAAAAGDVLCLASGSYGNFAGATKSSPGVTITAASGASPTMRFTFGSGDRWLILDGIEITGGHSDIDCEASNITVKNAEVSNYVEVCGDDPDSAIVLGPNLDFTYDDDPTGIGLNFEGRLSIMNGTDGSAGYDSAGILVTGDTFGPGNCADGIFSNQGGWTVVGSTFTELRQGSCDPHVDSVQWYAGANGNYYNVTFRDSRFVNNQSGIVDYDSHGNNVRILNSVFDTIPVPGINPCDAICLTGSTNTIVDHVTMRAAFFQNDANHSGSNATGADVTNSILAQPPVPESGSLDQVHHNLCLTGTCTGTGSLSGAPAPTWVGGANPSTFAGWALATSSRGENAASDGTDIGVNP